mmetsp:Transcript_70986/g.170044  ORF Transcript_70986/g.170044 Transcript_70986/m.170044 type:complete len:244 (+) Transcript_70986:106-837(+)
MEVSPIILQLALNANQVALMALSLCSRPCILASNSPPPTKGTPISIFEALSAGTEHMPELDTVIYRSEMRLPTADVDCQHFAINDADDDTLSAIGDHDYIADAFSQFAFSQFADNTDSDWQPLHHSLAVKFACTRTYEYAAYKFQWDHWIAEQVAPFRSKLTQMMLELRNMKAKASAAEYDHQKQSIELVLRRIREYESTDSPQFDLFMQRARAGQPGLLKNTGRMTNPEFDSIADGFIGSSF